MVRQKLAGVSLYYYNHCRYAKHCKQDSRRKYFDSGDYALNMAGAGEAVVGSSHPLPENIPHSVPQQAAPVKEHSALHKAVD